MSLFQRLFESWFDSGWSDYNHQLDDERDFHNAVHDYQKADTKAVRSGNPEDREYANGELDNVHDYIKEFAHLRHGQDFDDGTDTDSYLDHADSLSSQAADRSDPQHALSPQHYRHQLASILGLKPHPTKSGSYEPDWSPYRHYNSDAPDELEQHFNIKMGKQEDEALSLYRLIFEDIKLEKKAAKQVAKDLGVSDAARGQARSHAQELKDAAAGTRSLPREPSDRFRPELFAHIKRIRDEQRARQAEKRAAKERQRQRELEKKLAQLPEFTEAHQSHADNLVNHVADLYDAHRKMRVARAHLDAIKRVAPGHEDRDAWHKQHSDAGNALAKARQAILAGMAAGEIHPAHMEHVLQPALHDVDPNSKLHVGAVAHLLGGSPKGRKSFSFTDPESHKHFMSWSKKHHAHREPRAVDNRVMLEKGRFNDSSGLPSRSDLESYYKAFSKTGTSKSSTEDVAKAYAADRKKQIENGMLSHLLRKRHMKPTKGVDGLYHHRFYGGPNHGVMRVYTDIKGNYVDHSGKDDQDRVITDRAAKRLAAMQQQQRAESVGHRTLTILEARICNMSLYDRIFLRESDMFQGEPHPYRQELHDWQKADTRAHRTGDPKHRKEADQQFRYTRDLIRDEARSRRLDSHPYERDDPGAYDYFHDTEHDEAAELLDRSHAHSDNHFRGQINKLLSYRYSDY